MDNSKQKFIADGMLGRLARWLRILGFDTEYFSGKDKYFMLWKARKEKRVILTRDINLFAQNKDNCVFIKSEDLKQQIKELIKMTELVLKKELFFSRCNVCNNILKQKNLVDVIDKIPEYVAKTQRNFSYCNICGRIYWQGTHCKKMFEFISSIETDEK